MIHYNEKVKEYFFAPKHNGKLNSHEPDVIFVRYAPSEQGVIELYLKCTLDGKIAKACFKTNGNPYLIALMEWLCEQLEYSNSLQTFWDSKQVIDQFEIPLSHTPLVFSVKNVLDEAMQVLKKFNESKR